MKPARLEERSRVEDWPARFGRYFKQYGDLFSCDENRVSREQAEDLRDDTREVMSEIYGHVYYWEDRRSQFFAIAVALLAVSLTGIGLGLERLQLARSIVTSGTQGFYVGVTVGALVMFVGSIRVLLIWNRQNSPFYPFLKVATGWRHQYRNGEMCTRPGRDVVRLATAGGSKNEALEDMERYLKSQAAYAKRTLGLSPQEALAEDMRQLFMLIVLEKYRALFVEQLSNALSRTVWAAVGVAVALTCMHLVAFLINSLWLHFYMAPMGT